MESPNGLSRGHKIGLWVIAIVMFLVVAAVLLQGQYLHSNWVVVEKIHDPGSIWLDSSGAVSLFTRQKVLNEHDWILVVQDRGGFQRWVYVEKKIFDKLEIGSQFNKEKNRIILEDSSGPLFKRTPRRIQSGG